MSADKTKLVIFDLDGTIVVEPNFYKDTYSGSLNKVVETLHGSAGTAMLKKCREELDGKGELALIALNIPFKAWADELRASSVDSIGSNPDISEKIRSLKAIKVLYTGSPIHLARRMLERIGLDPDKDFDLIVGWKEPETLPTKWSCSPLVFENILRKFSVDPADAWAVGDVWETDLLPAQTIGIKTALVRKDKGSPDVKHPDLASFLDSL